VNLLILRKKQETKEYTFDSSGVPDFSLFARKCNFLQKCGDFEKGDNSIPF
jgi:hypothetical protein